MARSLNKVMLIGNVGNEPEIRTTAGGKRVAKFSVATNRSYTDRSGQQQEKTEWHRCTAWDRIAEIIEQYVHKGDRIYVEGSIEYSQTEDEGGKPRYWTDIVVREMVMLSGGGGGGGGIAGGQDFANRGGARRQSAPAPGPAGSPFDNDDDDLPF
ncbi:MAG TPA: single-stranded DNA-binding protein [Longimicrobiales bacterium]|nr:single-stranded DNA-binding protein [Longimicrobiales bacterium]